MIADIAALKVENETLKWRMGEIDAKVAKIEAYIQKGIGIILAFGAVGTFVGWVMSWLPPKWWKGGG